MKLPLVFLLSSAVILPATAAPLAIDETLTAEARWRQKLVLASRLLDSMESLESWAHHGPGSLTLAEDRHHEGTHCLRLTAPTKTDRPNRETGRPFGESGARRQFAGEDWREFNRLSVWVYPTLPGFKVISFLIKLHNEGAVKVPDGYNREGLHFVLLRNGQWNQVVWEIPHLARDKVTGVELIYRLQGNEPGATNQVVFDLDQLELQRVTPDHFEGWQVAPGKIAYSQSGYAVDGRKTALAGDVDAKEFTLVDAAGSVVLQKPVETVRTELGVFQQLDFSNVRQPGVYRLQAGKLATRPFAIRESAWTDTLWKVVNFFYCERCGDAIPGIHDVCHRDWQARHAGQTIGINGGWHDAGDLSQGLVNTAEAVQAMLELSETTASRRATPPSGLQPAAPPNSRGPGDPALSTRLAEEAVWGLEWLLKTRFGDGSRVTWATMDFWTDGVPGNADDVLGSVGDGPFDNFTGAAAEATAGRVLKQTHPELAARSLQAAIADWQFAVARTRSPNLELAAAGLVASAHLFQATGEPAYAEKAVELARVVTECQQREVLDAKVPLAGFFYTSPKRDRILHYFHRGHEQAPIVGLASLCALLPGHPDWMRWYSAVVLHSEYLRRVARYTEPYGMLPASIYSLNESNDPVHREQVEQGVPLGGGYYLRRFPVWTSFRGNHGTVLSQTKALSAAARLRGDRRLVELCHRQLEWVVGRNPFACSTMFGEGHDYLPQYTAMSGDMVGSLPVGIQTRGNSDQPYWPAANCYNYAEVWVHPASRWLAIAQDLLQFAPVSAPDAPALALESEADAAGQVTVRAVVRGSGLVQIQMRTSNLTLAPGMREVRLEPGKPATLSWQGRVANEREAWIVVAGLGGNLAHRCELVAPAR